MVVPETLREEGVAEGTVGAFVVPGGKKEVRVGFVAGIPGDRRPGLLIVPVLGVEPVEGGAREG